MKSVFRPPKIPVYQTRMCCSSTQPRVRSDPGQLSSQTSQHLPGSPGRVAASLLCYRGGTRRQRRVARPHVAGDITDIQFHLMIISLLGLLLANQSKNITSPCNIKITSECHVLGIFWEACLIFLTSYSLPFSSSVAICGPLSFSIPMFDPCALFVVFQGNTHIVLNINSPFPLII